MIAHLTSTEIARAEDLIDELRPQNAQWKAAPGEWIFRGLWDARFPLLPTAFRADAWEPFLLPGDTTFDGARGFGSEEAHLRREFGVLKLFFEGLDRAGLDIPNDVFVRRRFEEESQGDPEFLEDPAISTFSALAQHHGVPTRLLDWTRIGLHAAYFAACKAAKQYLETATGTLAVWALSSEFVERVKSIEAWSASLRETPRLRVVTAPRASNANLHAQVGLFTIWWQSAKVSPLDEVVSQVVSAITKDPAIDWIMNHGSPLHRLELPRSEAPKLLRLLSYEQVDAARLFPGHYGVVRAMRERSLWDQKT
jgi:hypothetical protein